MFPLRARIVPRKETNGPYPRGVIWDEDRIFLVFTTEFEEKSYPSPLNIYSAPSPTSHATLARADVTRGHFGAVPPQITACAPKRGLSHERK